MVYGAPVSLIGRTLWKHRNQGSIPVLGQNRPKPKICTIRLAGYGICPPNRNRTGSIPTWCSGHGDASSSAGPVGDTSGNGRDEVRVLAG